jgi:hypothetical protein
MALKFVEFVGTYRRQIDLKAWDERTVVGWLEDDFHHFGVTMSHDGKVVTDVRVAEPRHPWTACPGAAEPLRALIGTPLFGRCSDIGQFIDMRRQCTHLFDLAGLAIAHACHRREHRRYHATVCRLDALEPGAPADWLHAPLYCDGTEILAWDLHQGEIMRPAIAAGRTIDKGFREWIETLDEAEAEHAFVMRRAVFVAQGRAVEETERHTADEMGMQAVCHTYQPENRMHAVRIIESIHHFDDEPASMLSRVHTKP